MKTVPRVLLLIEASRRYGRDLLKGIVNYCNEHGPWAFVFDDPFYIQIEQGRKGSTWQVSEYDVDGIIMRETPDYKVVFDKEIPTIFVGHILRIPDATSIQSDNVGVGKMAAEYYIDRGFKNFAYVGYDNFFWSQERCKAYQNSLNEAGCELQIFKQPQTKQNDRQYQQKKLIDWLGKIKKPAAVFACNDDRARQIVSACNIGQIHIPDEVAVLGVDNDEFCCNLSNPPISSIALNVEQAGYKSAALLEGMMAGNINKPQEIIVEPQAVVTRQSTDILAINDPVVLAAVKFIKDNVHKPIQVSDVIDEVAVSRRCLYDKFSNFLGTSIYSYIKRCRVIEIKRLLTETDMSINEIALKLGFTTADHIAEYFRSETDLNPRQYRAKYE